MTTAKSVTSPPTSPPPKRIKTDQTPLSPNGTTSLPSHTIASPATEAPTMAAAVQVPRLLVKKLSDKARLPTRGSAFAAGYDVYASKETTIPARGKALVDTDIAISVPVDTYGRIAPRSGLASKHFIDTGAGVIDADYRGQVKILLFNHSDTDFAVAEGDRVAQLILERIYTPDVVEVADLEESVRGAGGFGSTGVAVEKQA
ncbi:deoxyuridine 5'-triphosphate nucleotidohydrolase [Plectosphaerella plurivora]|uniref:Deoxyuridine 5'-triphosphate nucleotidohydrolase n=1 Tax=Plectosphaerella plurivora TaxID=936078 RepID=A0A9P8VI98_9PEZI|nr:deoxyuridine 5'-triphosphate nucleotidohydrolase [Plectosphaerella plurivora]